MKTKDIFDIHKDNRKRCISALVLCSLVSLTAFCAIVIVITSKVGKYYLGLERLRFFTNESVIFVGIASLMCIPYQIDGLRRENYHLPLWLVNLLYIAVCTVTVTFVLAACIVLPFSGFHHTYIQSANFLPHLVVPLLSMVMFIFINDDHDIKKNILFYSFIPLVVYAVIYFKEVFADKDWKDHYHIVGVLPTWVSIPLVIIVYFFIAVFLRNEHNKRHQIRKQQIKEYYLTSEEVSFETIEEAIKNLAIRNKRLDKGGDLIVPRRIILMMEDKYQSGKDIKELCKIYIDNYK